MIDDTTTVPEHEELESTDEEAVIASLLSQRYPELPEEIYGLIASGKLIVDMTEIFEKQGIETGVRMPLSSLVFDILVGQMPPENFVPTVSVIIPQQELALAFSQEINRVIFSKVKDDLLFLHQKKGAQLSPSFATLKDRVGEKTPEASVTPVSRPTPSLTPTTPSTPPKPSLASTPDYREPSALEQKLSSFSVKPTTQAPSPTTQPQKTGDPYREAL